MAFPPGFLDELRSRISLSGLIGKRVKLIRRGREYAGLCPFHHEKTPSFYVVEEKSFFHCFSCGAHGDAIGFVMRADNLDFLEAIERLAGEAGLAVPHATPQERERAQQQKTLLEALEAAAAFYEDRLWSPAGSRALDYLHERGLDPETIRRFRLGWASDDRRALRRALSDFPEPLLVEAGLLRQPSGTAEGVREAIDYFRDRVMFPIGDRAGRVIAFGGRVLGDGQPKYLNSPESPLFAKGRVLYGWSAARAGAARSLSGGVAMMSGQVSQPGIIVTEGYMDVIALHRAGFPTAVAPLGTALTEVQLQELWRLDPEPVLCFDGDEAGRRAAARALYRALPFLRAGQSLRFATLPSGEDPDSLIRARGTLGFAEVLNAARPLSEKLWEIELSAKPIDTPERRAELWKRLKARAELISDREVQGEYRNLFYERLHPRRAVNSRTREVPPLPRSQERPQRQILFRILLHFPSLIDDVAEELASLNVPELDLDRLRKEILRIEASWPGVDAETLQQHLVQAGFAEIVAALLSPSLDASFVPKCRERISARSGWDHVIRMLQRGEAAAVAEEAVKDLGTDMSPERWEQSRVVMERARQQVPTGDEDLDSTRLIA
ncbi:MAG: DNA primase [Alphaproteobacteria bacterium]|nr:DNA primase [Alphaproteobacteria bacterium]